MALLMTKLEPRDPWPHSQNLSSGRRVYREMQPRLSSHCPLRVDCEATTPKISNLTLIKRSEAHRGGPRDGTSQKQHLRLRLESPRLRA